MRPPPGWSLGVVTDIGRAIAESSARARRRLNAGPQRPYASGRTVGLQGFALYGREELRASAH